ncbi:MULTISPECIES: hypothetical protein [unclassified Synechococcus]|uniref:hypothetical protein n=1 Tax=unclassified Synechococcus TaxID=2626047 RepID=UPI0020CF6DC2|nr:MULTISPECIES: hypothetical protein [unclassified Synechococcus]
MGELIGVGGASSGIQGGVELASVLVSLLALGLFSLFQSEQENDDDDSNPGGGLMQPVS